MIAVGSCIGSGIFVTPSDIAAQLQDPGKILLVWGIGGIVALTGALTFAELGGLFPKAGGVYVYIKEGFGQIWGFLYGWCVLTVITSGAIAALSLAFARYVGVFVTLDQTGLQIVGASAIVFATVINVLGVKFGEAFASIFTTLKLLGIGAIVLAGIVLGSHFSISPTLADPSGPVAQGGITAFALALIGVLWSFGGWHHASYVSAEAKDAKRNVPRAMMLGALIVTVTYLSVNMGYLSLMPVDEMAASKAVAADALQGKVPAAAMLVALLIAISTFGSTGIFTLSAPRIYYAMAADGTFFSAMARIHPKFQTPANAILLQSGWSLVLLFLWGTFEQLITYVVFMDWVFMTLAAITVFRFRKTFKEREPGLYRTWGYPIVPIIFIAISGWFIIYTVIGRPEQALAGLALLVIGVPVYLWYTRRKAG